jgi:hypothetical protein
MSPSEATNQATRDEWRDLGFFYETRDEPPCWRLVGSASGLANVVKLLDEYVRDPGNEAISEHKHYGPYMYLKVQTAESPEIDNDSIRGSLADLARLRDLIASGLRNLRAGESLTIGPEYSPSASFPLHLELREAEFDPASADPALSESAA